VENSDEEESSNQTKSNVESNINNNNQKVLFNIKNERLDYYIKNELNLDKNEIFDINFKLNNEKILQFDKDSSSFGIKTNNKDTRNDNKYSKEISKYKTSSYYDFVKENEKNKKANKKTDDSIKVENFLDANTNNIKNENTIQKFDNYNNKKINSKEASLEEYHKSVFFENFSITDNQSNINKLDSNLMYEYLVEEQKKYLKIYNQILSLNNDECQTKKRIIMVKLLKITFLIKFHRNFKIFNDIKFICEILRTYRYLFFGNIDFKICDIIIKKFIHLLHQANFYVSFLIAKNVFMILRDLSLKTENHILIQQKSDYFKIIFNNLFEKINFNNMNSFSSKEIGLLIYMMGETQLGTPENYQYLNKFIVEEIGKSVSSDNITTNRIQTFHKFVNFNLMGYCSNLKALDYSTTCKIIIDFLKQTENLPYKVLINFTISFFKLHIKNIFIWQYLFKSLIMYASFNKEKYNYNIKNILEYSFYIKKRIVELEELNKLFINFYLENFIKFLDKKFSEKETINNTKNTILNKMDQEEIKLNNDDLNKIIQELEIEGKKGETLNLQIKDKISNNTNVSHTHDSNDIDKTKTIEDLNYTENNNKEETINNKEILELFDLLYNKKLPFDKDLFNYIGDNLIFIKGILDQILKFCLNMNKITPNYVETENLSGIVLYRLRIDPYFNKNKSLIANYFNTDFSELNEKTEVNIIKILKIVDFTNIVNFNKFLSLDVFKKEEKLLYNKLIEYVKIQLDEFINNKSQLSKSEIDNYISDFQVYTKILENMKNEEYAKDLYQNLKNEIISFIKEIQINKII